MANAYQLVPLAWLRGVLDTLEQYDEQEADAGVQRVERLAPAARNTDPILQILDEDDAEYVHINGRGTSTGASAAGHGQPAAVADEFEPALALMSPRQQTRARVLLSFVRRSGATLDGHARLVYPASGKPGSTLYELLAFALSSPLTRKHKPQPSDYLDFMQLLDSAHCPPHLYARVEPSLYSYRFAVPDVPKLRLAKRSPSAPREPEPQPSTSTDDVAPWFVQE